MRHYIWQHAVPVHSLTLCDQWFSVGICMFSLFTIIIALSNMEINLCICVFLCHVELVHGTCRMCMTNNVSGIPPLSCVVLASIGEKHVVSRVVRYSFYKVIVSCLLFGV